MGTEPTTLLPGLLRRLRRPTGGAGSLPSADFPVDALIEAIDLVFFEADLPDFRVTYVSPNAERQFGWPSSEWLNDADIWARLLHAEDSDRVRARWKALTSAGITSGAKSGVTDIEHRVVTRSGETRWVRCVLHVTRPDDGGTPSRVRGAVMDVTARRQAEMAAVESEDRVRQLLDHAADALIVHDIEGRFAEVNRTACEALGYARLELIGMRVADVQVDLDEGRAKARWRELEIGKSLTFDAEYRRRDGSTFPVEVRIGLYDWSGKPHIVAVARDTSQRKRLEQQLRHSQKMEAVGRLAGGVAHDFNNLLTAIKGHAELLIQELGDGDASRDLGEISRAADRAAVLTRKLLAFSRQQIFAPEVLDLSRLVLETSRLLRPLIGEHIDFRTDLGTIGRVRADHGQIEQVLVNLVVNARDAMPSGGQLTISTSNLDVDEARPFRYTYVRSGHYVMLCVADSGTGMSADTMARIFEPFFTTKEKGKGSGLGLAIAYGIVKQSNGYLIAESEPGRGATFMMILPRSDAAIEVASADAVARPDGGNGRVVLVVEDEAPVRSLVSRVLTRDGFTVLEAASGEEAVARAHEFDGTIDLVISDLVMPGMDGRELSRHIGRTRPTIRTILMTGYSDDLPRRAADADADDAEMLHKPFTPAELVRRVRAALSLT